VKLQANIKAHLEWDLLQTTDSIMEELNWRVIDNRLKEQTLSEHDSEVLAIERGKHRDRLHKGIMKLKESVPGPIDEDAHCTTGIEEEPDDEPKTLPTADGLAQLMKKKEERREEIAMATYLNWSVSDPNVVENVLIENWERTEVGGELWMKCEKLRELILGDRMPEWADEERRHMQESSEAIGDRGDWHLDPRSTYHRRDKERPNPKCPVPVEDVERHFKSVWEPIVTPENTFVAPTADSPWHIPPPDENSLNLGGSFGEWMRNEDGIRACLKSKHNLFALGLDGIGYLHLTYGGDPMIKLISMIFGDCAAERKVSQA
jgi:hypothetical protein